MRININTGAFTFAHGAFLPTRGRTRFIGNPSLLDNPSVNHEHSTYAGLIILGRTTRGSKRRFRPANVVQAVIRFRTTHGEDPGASFIRQLGVYRHPVSGHVVTEDSLRIILANLSGQAKADFRESILDLAEHLRQRYDQEEVIVEFQNGGVNDGVIGVKA